MRNPWRFVPLTALVLGCQAPQSSSTRTSPDAVAIRAARVAQNKAIVANDLDAIASYWTDDVTIRRGLGTPVAGRAAYRQLWVPAGKPDSALVYQREPSTIEVSPTWPLAYESGTWVGHLGRVD